MSKSWLNVPFRWHGYTRFGCDCVGLVVGVLHENNIIDDIFIEKFKCVKYGTNLSKIDKIEMIDYILLFFDQIYDIEMADLLLVSTKYSPIHFVILGKSGENDLDTYKDKDIYFFEERCCNAKTDHFDEKNKNTNKKKKYFSEEENESVNLIDKKKKYFNKSIKIKTSNEDSIKHDDISQSYLNHSMNKKIIHISEEVGHVFETNFDENLLNKKTIYGMFKLKKDANVYNNYFSCCRCSDVF